MNEDKILGAGLMKDAIRYKEIIAYKETCTDPFVKQIIRRFLGANNANGSLFAQLRKTWEQCKRLQDAIKDHKKKHFLEGYSSQCNEANLELWELVNDDLEKIKPKRREYKSGPINHQQEEGK
jgi:hypothetical protein